MALREWARRDPAARAVQEAVDRERMAFVAALATEAGCPPDGADDLARTLVLLLVGAEHAVPPVGPDDLRRLFDRAVTAALGPWAVTSGAGRGDR